MASRVKMEQRQVSMQAQVLWLLWIVLQVSTVLMVMVSANLSQLAKWVEFQMLPPLV
jgi:hypothetical protein